MKQFLLSTFLIVFFISINAQKKTSVLLTIEDTPITSEEFIRVYTKNNSSSENIETKSVDEYLQLFIDYKLKVLEAKNRKMDTIPAFIEEYKKYKEQLEQSYLSDTDIEEAILKEAYDRTVNEVNASHILIRVKPDASPEDTLEAYNKIVKIRDRILKEGDFEKIANEVSEDPSAKRNNGNLGYFYAFRMVYPFENAAYNTPVGEVSMPVRTQFGYHLIKVNKKIKSQGSIEVAHIMILTPQGMSQAEQDSAKAKIDRIYQEYLNGGVKFYDLARKYSEDKNTAHTGGKLNPFKRGQIVPEFEEAAFALEKDGTVSPPIKTDFGWHIIYRATLSPIPDYEKLKPELEANVRRYGRNKLSEERYVEKLKNEYSFNKNNESLNEVKSIFDSISVNPEWVIDTTSRLNKTLFTFSDQKVEQKEFATFLISKFEKSKTNPPSIDEAFNEFSSEKIVEFERDNLVNKYPEFKNLTQEYYEGILLFNLMDSVIWSKTITDTTGVKEFFKSNIDDYMLGERLNLTTIQYDSTVLADSLMLTIENALKDSIKLQTLKSKFCPDSNLNCLYIKSETLEKGESGILEKIEWEKGIYHLPEETKFIVVNLVLPSEPMKLDSVRGQVTSDYQTYLEKEWMTNLRAKYSVTIDEKALKKVKKKLK